MTEHPAPSDEDEQAYRDAIAAGDDRALAALAQLLAGQPGREREAETALRDAIAAGHANSANTLGLLLAGQRGREREAELTYRDAIAAGNVRAAINLAGLLLVQPGRRDEAEQLLRQGLAVGDGNAAMALGNLLCDQPGRAAEAERFYRESIASASSELVLEYAAFGLGDLLARAGDEDGARAAYDLAGPLSTKRVSTKLGCPRVGPPPGAARIFGVRIAIVRRPRLRRIAAALGRGRGLHG